MRPRRNTFMYKYKQTKQFSNMERFNYKIALEYYAKATVAALYWCKRENVCVNKQDKEVDWLHRQKTDEWKPLWKILGYFPYTTRTFVDHNKETSEFNFSIGGMNDDETRGLASLLFDVWFGYVGRKYHKKDNKTALKLQNRLTGQIVYLGWYDGRFTVTELPAIPDSDFKHDMFEINED